jgi:hypothetical protein
MQRNRRVEIAGHLPAGLRNEISRRLGPIDLRAEGSRSVLELQALDEAAVRALLELLWESGVAVLDLSTASTPDED